MQTACCRRSQAPLGLPERLVELLSQNREVQSPTAHAYLVAVGENSTETALKLAYDLRAGVPGLRLMANLNGGSFKAQFKRADRSDAHIALILGEEEVLNGRVAVKFLRSGEQQLSLDRNEVESWLQAYIEAL